MFFRVCGECSGWGEAVNNLVEKVNGANGNLIFAPILELDEGESAVFGMFYVKNNYAFATIVCELRGGVGVGGGVGHAQSLSQGRIFTRTFCIKNDFLFCDFVKIFLDKLKLL